MKKEVIQHYSLRIFLVCLFSTATLFLIALWFFEEPAQTYFKTMATFFVFGFAAFLVWFTTTILQIKDKVEKP